MIPLSSIKKTLLTAAVEFRAGWIMPYFFATFMFRSAMTGNGIVTSIFSLMLRIQARCADMLSTESPTSFTLSAASSSLIAANAMNSVVQTGVKSAGCENSTTHFPFRSESLIGPCVVCSFKVRGRFSQCRKTYTFLFSHCNHLLCFPCRELRYLQWNPCLPVSVHDTHLIYQA